MTGASPSAVFATDLQINMTPTTVGIRTTSTVNNYGERTFSGSVTNYDAYVRKATNADRSETIDNKVIEYVAHIPHQTLAVDVDDEITLPAPASGISPIVKVDIKTDALGQVGLIVYCGKA